MSIIINSPKLSPENRYPFPHGLIDYYLETGLDVHAWLTPDDGGGVTWQPETCALAGTPRLGDCDIASLNAVPDRALRPTQTAEAVWQSISVTCSTVPGEDPDLLKIARRDIRNSLDLALDQEVQSLLAAEAIPLSVEDSVLCAVGQAQAALAAIPGDGVGLIHISPLALAVLQNGHLLTKQSGKLVDISGNVYRVSRTQPADTLYFEAEAGYRVYLSPIEELDETTYADVTRTRNDRIVTVVAGYILVRSSCSVGSVTYSCQ